MKKCIALIFILILSVSSICNAFQPPNPDRWYQLNSREWIDTATFECKKAGSDRIAIAWILYYSPENNEFDFTSKTINEFNIDQRLYRRLSSFVYNSNGKVIYSDTTPTAWTVIIPDTNGEKTLNIIETLYEIKTISSKKL